MMVLKTAIVTPHTMMVFILLPSQTIRIGASAVLAGCSEQRSKVREYQQRCGTTKAAWRSVCR